MELKKIKELQSKPIPDQVLSMKMQPVVVLDQPLPLLAQVIYTKN